MLMSMIWPRDLGGQSSGLFHAGRVAAEDLGGGGMSISQLEQGDGFLSW